MVKKLMDDKLAALKEQLDSVGQPLGDGEQESIRERLADLERQLAVQMPVDAEDLENRLLAWELEVAENHPLLATVVREAMQRLLAMGI